LIYVDTSLLLPVYVLEAGSEQANRILESASPILISDLTVAEFHVGLARKVKLGELSVSQSEAARASFESHLEEGLLRRVALLSSHSEAAGRLASKSGVILRTLDASSCGGGGPRSFLTGNLRRTPRRSGPGSRFRGKALTDLDVRKSL
jgi:predicted nucleic acid-binding protein